MNRILFRQSEVPSDGVSFCLSRRDRRARHMLEVHGARPGTQLKAGVIGESVGVLEVCATPGLPHAQEYLEELELRYYPQARAPSLLQVTLIVGQVRPIVMKRMLRDCAAVGIERLIISGCRLAERSYARSSLWTKCEWEGFFIQGAEQGGHARLPVAELTSSVNEALDAISMPGRGQAAHVGDAPGHCGGFASGGEVVAADGDTATDLPGDIRLLADSEGRPPVALLPDGRERHCREVVCAVGPERGFVPEERELLLGAGFLPVSFGPGILRTEIAAQWALCIAAACLGESSPGVYEGRR